jgi:tRNA A-37 threonylcarbamoyl transferase component Bud32
MSQQQPIEGPLAKLPGEVEVLVAPRSLRRPWVVASGDRVFKAYDLSHFDATDRDRLMAEAEIALELGDLEGVVTTYGHRIEDGWLVIEMDRLGETLGDRLAAIEAGTSPALEPGRWGALFEIVARTLNEVHRRRRLHRDVKPGNLIFDRDGERLLVADFSVAMRRPRRSREGKAGLAGTRRYIAPEVMRGRVGPAADQYGLAVTAADALGKSRPPAAKPVLLRATEQNPEDRYGSIADFGLALRAALDEAARRRVSLRLQRVSVRWRLTWAVGAAAFVGTYGWLLWSRPSTLNWEDGVVLPLLAALFTMLVSRMLNPLRGGRSRPRLAIADRSWFPVLLFALALAAFMPLFLDNPSKAGKTVLALAIGALALATGLGSVRREAGERLIGVVRRWESWRETQRGRPGRWWGVRALAIGGLVLVAALPAVVAQVWPRHGPRTPAEVAPIALVAEMRTQLLGGHWQRACELARVPAGPTKVDCSEWAPLVGGWMQDEVRGGTFPFGIEQLSEMRLSGTADEFGEPVWRIRERTGEGRDFGTLARENENDRVWGVTIGRRPLSDEFGSETEAVWRFEVLRRGDRWWVTAIEVCDFNSSPACIRPTQADRSDLPRLTRTGPPDSTSASVG